MYFLLQVTSDLECSNEELRQEIGRLSTELNELNSLWTSHICVAHPIVYDDPRTLDTSWDGYDILQHYCKQDYTRWSDDSVTHNDRIQAVIWTINSQLWSICIVFDDKYMTFKIFCIWQYCSPQNLNLVIMKNHTS